MVAIIMAYSTGAANASRCGWQNPKYRNISSAKSIEILSTCSKPRRGERQKLQHIINANHGGVACAFYGWKGAQMLQSRRRIDKHLGRCLRTAGHQRMASRLPGTSEMQRDSAKESCSML